MLDLFAGLGGQSEAFIRLDRWDVLRIDNNPLLGGVENMVIMDVKHLEPHESSMGRIEYVHAAPPCTEFSHGYSGPKAKAYRAGEEFLPDMTLILEAIRIIRACNPRFWSLENVRGSIPFLKPILGEPHLIVGPYVYWGNFPKFDPSKIQLTNKADKDRRHSPIRANHKAKVDLALSEAFRHAIEAQRSIFDRYPTPQS